MGWYIGLSQDFDAWFRDLEDDDQEAVVVAVEQVKELGANLDDSPLVRPVRRGRRRNMRELKVAGREVVVRFTFDEHGPSILLHAGSSSTR